MRGDGICQRGKTRGAVVRMKEGGKATGERYLPKKARESLSSSEYAATTRAKREGTRKGKQHVPQPKKIAKKTARSRKT